MQKLNLILVYNKNQDKILMCISKNDIKLINVMNFTYCLEGFEIEIYYGILNKECNLVEEVNKLYWVDKAENFFDIDRFAGEGNIYHIIKRVELYKEKNIL